MRPSNVKNIPVVLLAAGEGSRLRPLSDKIIKPLIPIAGTPIIERIINIFHDSGFSNIIIVTGDEHQVLKDHLDALEKVISNQITIDYVIQSEPNGMADAIARTEEIVKKDSGASDFIVSAADVIFNKDTPSNLYSAHIKADADATLSLIMSKDDNMAEGHGNVQLENQKITKIIEKPGSSNKISDFYSMPFYVFSSDIYDYIRKINKSERGELEIQDAIQSMIDKNKTVVGIDLYPDQETSIRLEDIGKYHLTYIKDVLSMTFRFLENQTLKFDGEWPATMEPITAAGVVKSGDSLLLGPNVYLGEDCELDDLVEISNSILMGKNKIGKSTIIANSIIFSGVEIGSNKTITGTLILDEDVSESLK